MGLGCHRKFEHIFKDWKSGCLPDRRELKSEKVKARTGFTSWSFFLTYRKAFSPISRLFLHQKLLFNVLLICSLPRKGIAYSADIVVILDADRY